MAEATSKRVVAADGGRDRLSALPDEMLHSIMSFLMARQIVQTSVLARRWKDLWRSTPCLDIDHREFSGHDQAASWRKLHDFTSNLLKNHQVPLLERFRLHVGAHHIPSAVDGWIRRGIRDRPAALEIKMADPDPRFAPSLVPALACRLTRMRLCRVRLNGGFAQHLRSGACPVLEDLVLTGCDCDRDFQEIVSSTLKSLAIECCGYTKHWRIAVTAPALASFRLISRRHDLFLVNGPAGGSPLQASITFNCEFCYEVTINNMFGLLGSLCNVTTLELWGLRYKMDAWYYQTLTDEEVFPDLHNLTTLLMGECEMSMQFGLLRLFMKNAPSLERITLKHCKYSSEYTRRHQQRKISPRYQKLLCYQHYDLKLIGVKYKETNTSNLFGLLMGIRSKLEENTIVLTRN